jgi:hypothetical protein
VRVIDIASYMQVAGNPDRPVVSKLQEASGLVDQPEFAGGCRGCSRYVTESATNYDSVLGVTFLG